MLKTQPAVSAAPRSVSALCAAFLMTSTAVFWSNQAACADRLDIGERPPSRRIMVATRDVPPFSMRNDEGQWEGISIELLREIKAEFESEGDGEISLEFKAMSLEEMLDAVANAEVDVAVAALTVNYEREKQMDFTHPFHSAGLGIAVSGKQGRSGRTGMIEAIFSTTFLRLIAGLFAAMLVSAVAIHVFERKQNREHFGGGWFRGVAAGLWWAAVTLTTVGYGDKVPRSIPGRLIGMVWMFSGLFIIAGFTAAVTTTLTVTQLQSQLSGPSDLSRVRVATVDGSTSSDYLEARHIRFTKHGSVEDALDELKRGGCDAVVYDEPSLRYQAFHSMPGEVYVLPVTFERQNYAFALTNDSPLREPINQSLLRQTSKPTWGDVLESYLGEASP